MVKKIIKTTLMKIVNHPVVVEKRKKLFAKLTVKLINSFKVENADFTHFDYFEYWQKNGFNIISNNFYQPISNLADIDAKKFKKAQELIGIDLQESNQLKLLNDIFSRFKKEYDQIPALGDPEGHTFYFNNLAFDGVDALVYYCNIRYFHPKTIIEVGSGWSTKIAAQANLFNKGRLLSIEPYPQQFMQYPFPGFTQVVADRVENIPISYFNQLNMGDILFIDSSHTVKTGGDVNYLFLEILPRLKKGVVIHIHDIFFPFDYPEEWVLNEHRFWAEQYMLQAFLMFNSAFKILYSNSYMGYKHLQKVKTIFPNSPFYKGGSIWIQKVK